VGQHDRTVRNPARRLTGAATDDRLSTSRWGPLADHGRGRGPRPQLAPIHGGGYDPGQPCCAGAAEFKAPARSLSDAE
jgi:hypothetical protein